jgi:hypothetical protein
MEAVIDSVYFFSLIHLFMLSQNGFVVVCCWAMAAVASVEALHYLHTKQSITLSVQELIDCDTKNNGCKGGYSKVALEYIVKNGLSS